MSKDFCHILKWSLIIIEDSKYIYGKNPVREKLKIIKSGILYIKKNINYSSIQDIVKKAKSKKIQITSLENNDFDNKFKNKNHQGIALKIDEDYTKLLTFDDFLTKINNQNNFKSIIIILDGINDVGNFGAILRSALLFGVDGVILPKNNSTPINDAVVKCSAGAVFQLDIIYVTNLIRTIQELKKKEYWIYGAEKSGENISKIKFSNKCVIIFGSENKGIRHLVKENCDFIISIPTNDKLDSLNLSVSAGIVLYELAR